MADVGVSSENNGGITTAESATPPPSVVVKGAPVDDFDADQGSMDSAAASQEEILPARATVPSQAQALETTESAGAAAEHPKNTEFPQAVELAERTQSAEASRSATEATVVTESATESAEAEREAVGAAEPTQEVTPGSPVPSVPDPAPEPEQIGDKSATTEAAAATDNAAAPREPNEAADDGNDAEQASSGGITGWISGLAPYLGFGGADDKRSSDGDGSDASEDDPEVVVVVPELPAVEGSSISKDGGSSEGTGVDGGGQSSEAGGGLSPTILKKRNVTIAAEMKAFLEDSDSEDGVGGVAKGLKVEVPAEAGTGSVRDREESLGAGEEPCIFDDPPRSPKDDTEFSARHAKRVIGSGVVLERKASISAGPPSELKNKSQFSAKDAAAMITAGAISERARKLKEEQEALRIKHATERQDTDFAVISNISKTGSVRGKADMYHQALGGGGAEKTSKPMPPSGRLTGDWTQRRESLEQFVVKYEAPEKPSATPTKGAAEAPRYIPLPSDVGTPQPRLRGGSGAHPYGSFASTPTNGTSGGGGAAGWGGGGRENAPGSSSKPEEASGQTGSVSFAAATTVGEGAKEADTGGSMQEQPTTEDGAQYDHDVAPVASPSPAPSDTPATAAAAAGSGGSSASDGEEGDGKVEKNAGGGEGKADKAAFSEDSRSATPSRPLNDTHSAGSKLPPEKTLGDTDAGTLPAPQELNGETKASPGATRAPPALNTQGSSSSTSQGGCCTVS